MHKTTSFRQPRALVCAWTASLAALMAGCTAPGIGAPPAAATPVTGSTQPVTIQFAAQVNGQPFACGQRYAGIGTSGSTITPGDLRFFVSDVQLVEASGRTVPVTLTQDGMWQLEGITLLDFEDGSGPCRNGTTATNTAVRGTTPAGHYTGLRFTLGASARPACATSP